MAQVHANEPGCTASALQVGRGRHLRIHGALRRVRPQSKRIAAPRIFKELGRKILAEFAGRSSGREDPEGSLNAGVTASPCLVFPKSKVTPPIALASSGAILVRGLMRDFQTGFAKAGVVTLALVPSQAMYVPALAQAQQNEQSRARPKAPPPPPAAPAAHAMRRAPPRLRRPLPRHVHDRRRSRFVAFRWPRCGQSCRRLHRRRRRPTTTPSRPIIRAAACAP